MIYLTLLAVLCCSLTSSTPLNSRIINGVDAPNTPWVAYINITAYNGNFWCTGSLVAPDWILTAKHCILNFENSVPAISISITIGDVNRNKGQTIKALYFRVYSWKSILEDDIGLLKLERKVEGITPVKVQNNNVNYHGKVATIYGWGLTIHSNVGTAPTLLQTTKVVINNELFIGCGSLFMCFNPEENGSNFCHGDSGGPMVIEENNEIVLIGIGHTVANGNNCTGSPSEYFSTSVYGDWIQNTINSEL